MGWGLGDEKEETVDNHNVKKKLKIF